MYEKCVTAARNAFSGEVDTLLTTPGASQPLPPRHRGDLPDNDTGFVRGFVVWRIYMVISRQRSSTTTNFSRVSREFRCSGTRLYLYWAIQTDCRWVSYHNATRFYGKEINKLRHLPATAWLGRFRHSSMTTSRPQRGKHRCSPKP